MRDDMQYRSLNVREASLLTSADVDRDVPITPGTLQSAAPLVPACGGPIPGLGSATVEMSEYAILRLTLTTIPFTVYSLLAPQPRKFWL